MFKEWRKIMWTTAALTVLAACLLVSNARAQGVPVDTGSHVPVALWFVGVFVLGIVILYGITRNRRRSRAEKQLTEQATQDNYRREDRDG
jgi:cbb3-type cytochrome oxidase subunit 1